MFCIWSRAKFNGIDGLKLSCLRLHFLHLKSCEIQWNRCAETRSEPINGSWAAQPVYQKPSVLLFERNYISVSFQPRYFLALLWKFWFLRPYSHLNTEQTYKWKLSGPARQSEIGILCFDWLIHPGVSYSREIWIFSEREGSFKAFYGI